jgi:hypothetical protein
VIVLPRLMMPTNRLVNTQNVLIGCIYTSSRASASHGFNIWLVDVEGEVDGRHVTRSL